jgi:hypothetical protein
VKDDKPHNIWFIDGEPTPGTDCVAALRARIEELTIPADTLQTIIELVDYAVANMHYDVNLPEEVAWKYSAQDAQSWLTAYKEAQG